MNEIINTIRTLLSTTLTTTYKKYYYWEIRVPSQSIMPFIEVIPISTTITNRGTWWMTNNEYQIWVSIKNTLKKYLAQNTDTEILAHVEDLVKKMEDRETNWDLKDATVLGVLHNNLKLSDKANIMWDWNITYDEIDLWESYITVATVIFTVKVISY